MIKWIELQPALAQLIKKPIPKIGREAKREYKIEKETKNEQLQQTIFRMIVGDAQYIPMKSPSTVGKRSYTVDASQRINCHLLEILAFYYGNLEEWAHFYRLAFKVVVDMVIQCPYDPSKGHSKVSSGNGPGPPLDVFRFEPLCLRTNTVWLGFWTALVGGMGNLPAPVN